MSRFTYNDVHWARACCENLADILVLLCETRDSPSTLSVAPVSVKQGQLVRDTTVTPVPMIADDLERGIERLRQRVADASSSVDVVGPILEKTAQERNGFVPAVLGGLTAPSNHAVLVKYSERLRERSTVVLALAKDHKTDWQKRGPDSAWELVRQWLGNVAPDEISSIRTQLACEANATIDRLALLDPGAYRTVGWFKEVFGVNPGTLRAAAAAKRETSKVRSRKNANGRTEYSVDDARQIWPHSFENRRKPLGSSALTT